MNMSCYYNPPFKTSDIDLSIQQLINSFDSLISVVNVGANHHQNV